MRVRALLLGFVFVATVVLGTGVAAAATVPGTIAMYSDPGDDIGQGGQQVFAGPVSATGSSGDFTLNFGGTSWYLRFAAPTGAEPRAGRI
jgi:hypothetical protein